MTRFWIFCAAIVFTIFSAVPMQAGIPIQLTDSPASDRHPTWSADGSFVVFESNRSGTAWHLYRVSASGGPATQVSFAQDSQLAPEISPDGSKIVYAQGVAGVSSGAMNSSAICVMPVDGGAPITLVPNDGKFRYHPTWSPDGSTIFFSLRLVPGDGAYDIYKVSAAGGSEKFVVDLGDEDFTQTVSPDGATLTWASHDLGAPYNLYQAPLVTPAQATQLTFESANTSQPDYSPDGTFVAFASRRVLGRLDIYQVSLASHDITRLTFDAENSDFDPLSQFPTYSPDGRLLAFSSSRITGDQNVWVLPLVDTPPPTGDLLSIGSGEGIPGPGTVILPITLLSDVATPALEFEIVDTPDWLHIVSVTARGRAAGFTASFADQEKPHVVMYGASGQLIPPGNGPILDIEVEVRAQAVEGDSTQLSFDNIVMADKDGQPVTVDWKGNYFHVRRLPGDVNGDNAVDTGDIVRLVEIILKNGAPPSGIELAEADCNDDAAHNALDIVCLLDLVLEGTSRMAYTPAPAPGTWTIRTEEPVSGLEFLTAGGDWSSIGASLSPFQMHQPTDLTSGRRIAFDAQGASWNAGSVRTFAAPSTLRGVRAFGPGGRAIPVRIEGNEIRIGAPLPTGLRVLPAAPNPFSGATALAFSLDTPARVTVRVYDVRGALVSSPESRMLPAGRHVWPWSAKDDRGNLLPSGLYIAVVDSGTRRSAVRLNHLR